MSVTYGRGLDSCLVHCVELSRSAAFNSWVVHVLQSFLLIL